VLTHQSAFAGGANSCQSRSKNMCFPLTPQQEIAAEMCRIEMKEAKCEEFYKTHPDLEKDKQRDCDLVASCSTSEKLNDYTEACLENWAGAWGDMLTGIYHIVAGDIKLSPESKEREKFFAECTSAECKRNMLGPYAELFSKEEIEGQPYDKKLYPEDSVYQAHLQGLSAKVLYKKLLERISLKMKEGTLDQPVLEPWSKKPAKPLKTVQEMVDNALSKMGIKNSVCYDPVLLSEMRCYALFTVLDPLLFVGASAKVAALAGKNVEKALAKEALLAESKIVDEAATLGAQTKKLEALKANTNAVVDRGIVKGIEREKIYVKKANENSDPATDFWKENGVVIKEDGSISLNSAEVAQNIDTKVDNLVSSGIIKESETLRPVLVYKLKGKTITVSPNEIPPAGAVRAEGLVEDSEFFKMVAEGKYPMGMDDATGFSTYPHKEPAFLHDANHFSGFVGNPEFMAASRKAAQKILATKDPVLRKTLENRYFFASELSQTFSKKEIAAATSELDGLKKKLGLSTKGVLSYTQYNKALRALPEKELDKLWDELPRSTLLSARPDALGGSEHQIQHRYSGRAYDNVWPFESRTYTNHASTSETRAREPIHPIYENDEHASRLAKMIEKADAFIRVHPEDWMTEGTSGRNLPRNGNTTRLCKVRDVQGSHFWSIYCAGR